jgi:hypothetical protein
MHLRLGLPSGLFPSGFSTNILYAFIFSPIRATCPAHLTLLDLIILKSYEAPHYADFSNLLSPDTHTTKRNVILSATFPSQPISPVSRFSLNVQSWNNNNSCL